MKKLSLAAILAVFCLIPLGAQEISTAAVYHPGDPIHISVILKTPASIASATFTFSLVGEIEKGQETLTSGFSGNNFKSLSETKFEVSGAIPEHIAGGNYKLTAIAIAIDGVSKYYSNQKGDFKELTITVVNPEHPAFPKIDDVKIAP
jgi:hypothetical protein